jgi:hypothetical protein
MSASGKLKNNPTIAPLTQPGTGKSKLKIMNPIANRLTNEAVIAVALSSNFMKNIGTIEANPKIVPAISPFIRFVITIGLVYTGIFNLLLFTNY